MPNCIYGDWTVDEGDESDDEDEDAEAEAEAGVEPLSSHPLEDELADELEDGEGPCTPSSSIICACAACQQSLLYQRCIDQQRHGQALHARGGLQTPVSQHADLPPCCLMALLLQSSLAVLMFSTR